MSVTYRGVAVQDSGSGTSTSPTVPAPVGVQDGDLMVAFYMCRKLADFTPPAGWTSIVEQDTDNSSVNAANSQTCHAFWRVRQSGDPSSWTGTSSAANTYGVIVIAVFGQHATSPIGSHANSGAINTATVTYPSITVANDGSMLVGAVGATATSTGEPSGATERGDLGSGSGGPEAGDAWTLPADAGATGSLTATIGGGTIWASVMVEIVPPGAILAAEWGAWSASASAAPTTFASFDASWGAWTATATAGPVVNDALFDGAWGSWAADGAFNFVDGAILAGPWGSWAADAGFTVTTLAELEAAWGSWVAEMVAGPAVSADAFTADWGAWVAEMEAGDGPVLLAEWGAWSAAGVFSVVPVFRAEWGSWTAVASFVQPQVLELSTVYSRPVVPGLYVRHAGVVLPELEFQVVDPVTGVVKGTIVNPLEGSGWEDVWCDAGAGTLRLAFDEPSAALIARGDVVRCHYRGAAVFQWVVDGSRKVSVPASGDDADLVNEWSGAGRITSLNHARIRPSRGFDQVPLEDSREFGWASFGYAKEFFWPYAKEIIRQGAQSDIWLLLNNVPADWPDPGAFWIWGASGNQDLAPPGFAYTRFKGVAASGGRIRIYAAIDNRGTVYFDGVKVLDVEGFAATQQYEIDISAGEHSLAVVAENFVDDGDPGNNPAGILIAVYYVKLDGTLGELLWHTDGLWKLLAYPPSPPGTSAGWVLTELINEAKANGLLENLETTFDYWTDSLGNPWPEIAEAAAPVGRDLWAFVQQLTAADIDVALAPGAMILHAWRKGDGGVSTAVTLHPPTDVDDPSSGNLTALTHEGVSKVATAAVVRYASSWTYVDITPDGAEKIETELDFGHLDSRSEARRLATQELRRLRRERVQHEAEIVVRDGEVPWHDYRPGDFVEVPDEDGDLQPQRVVALAATLTVDELVITPTLQDRLLEADERREAWLKASADGFNRGDSKAVGPAFPPPPPPRRSRSDEQTWSIPGALSDLEA
jgi:hypothetical protein